MSIVSSMTGYGETSVEVAGANCSIRLQFKSVNSRFLDFTVRVPAIYSGLEAEVQKKVKAKIKRGRVEISASRSSLIGGAGTKINLSVLNGFLSQLDSLEVKGLSKKEVSQSSLSSLLSRKEIFEGTESELLSEEEKSVFLAGVDSALDSLVESRLLEGKSLLAEMLFQTARLKTITDEVEAFSSLAPVKIKEKFELRLKELLSGNTVSNERLEQEVAILADKVDIREELVRLRSHLVLFQNSIDEGGRKLEFVLQEMGREVNTIGSKSNEAGVSTLVIEAKSILEKLREQIQNVE